ncbi:MAG: HU family DNA-binding protein [Candidatus Margulisiibacteriota bacterium]
MNQKELAEKLAAKFGDKKAQMERIVDAAIEMLTETLAKGEKVRLVGFGNFAVKTRKGRIGRNPRTGQQMEISATKCPVFVAGFNLKKAIRGK